MPMLSVIQRLMVQHGIGETHADGKAQCVQQQMHPADVHPVRREQAPDLPGLWPVAIEAKMLRAEQLQHNHQ